VQRRMAAGKSERLEHNVRLISAAYMKLFVKRQKNNAADAEAILGAAKLSIIHFVAVKTEVADGDWLS